MSPYVETVITSHLIYEPLGKWKIHTNIYYYFMQKARYGNNAIKKGVGVRSVSALILSNHSN